MTRSLIFVFLILYLILTPVTAEVEPLDIYVKFPKFYEGNFSGERAKVIGTVGIPYQGIVVVGSPNEEVNLANRSLELKFSYKDIPKSEISEQKTTDREIFWYYESPKYSYEFSDTFNLSEKLGKKLCKEEYKSFPFDIAFLETGMYKITWIEQSEKCCSIKSTFISIVEPIEWVKLTKQSQLLDAEKKSAEASENAAKYTLGMAIATAALAFFTFVTVTQIRKDRGVDLLRRRLGNLYSMLKFNKDILNQKPPLRSAHAKYELWMDFYTKFKENLYLASDELVQVAEKFLEYIDLNKVPEEKEKEFFEIRRNLIEQIDSDYDKYLKKLLKLTKKPKW